MNHDEAVKNEKSSEHLKINSNITNKILKDVVPNINKSRIKNQDIKTETSIYGKFVASYMSYDGKTRTKLKIESLNDINKLSKENKFNKFCDFLSHCLDQCGIDRDGYLRIPYNQWLEYTKRSKSDRMIKEARKEVKEFMEILRGIKIEYEGRSNKGYGSVAFTHGILQDTVIWLKYQ